MNAMFFAFLLALLFAQFIYEDVSEQYYFFYSKSQIDCPKNVEFQSNFGVKEESNRLFKKSRISVMPVIFWNVSRRQNLVLAGMFLVVPDLGTTRNQFKFGVNANM